MAEEKARIFIGPQKVTVWYCKNCALKLEGNPNHCPQCGSTAGFFREEEK